MKLAPRVTMLFLSPFGERGLKKSRESLFLMMRYSVSKNENTV